MRSILLPVFLLCACRVLAQDSLTTEILRQADQFISDYRFEEALRTLDSAHDSLDIGLLQRKGRCYARLGNYYEAIRAYEGIRRTDSLNRESLLSLGQLYSSSDQPELAGRCYEKLIELDSLNSYYHKQYAAVSLKKNDPISAISYYLQTVHLNPRDMEAYAQLSNVLLDAEQYIFVDSMLTGVLESRESNQLRLLLARAELGQENYAAVLQNIEQILQTADTTVTYARLMGISYFLLDQYDKAIPCLEYLTNKGAKSDWLYYYLGVSHQKQGNIEKAITFLNLAVEEGISDHIGAYYSQLAAAYEEAKDFKNAIRNYKIAYETSKADIMLYHLARNYDVYYKDKTQAQIYYKKYLDSDDTVKLAKQYSRYRLDALSDLR